MFMRAIALVEKRKNHMKKILCLTMLISAPAPRKRRVTKRRVMRVVRAKTPDADPAKRIVDHISRAVEEHRLPPGTKLPDLSKLRLPKQ